MLNITGVKVRHKEYGSGTVVKQDGNRFYVKFVRYISHKSFSYPEAFIQNRMTIDLIHSYVIHKDFGIGEIISQDDDGTVWIRFCNGEEKGYVLSSLFDTDKFSFAKSDETHMISSESKTDISISTDIQILEGQSSNISERGDEKVHGKDEGKNDNKIYTTGCSYYDALYKHLLGCGKDSIKLSFADLETILHNKLSPSAYTNNKWWTNGGTKQSEAWLKAGYKVECCTLYGRRFVVFVRMVNSGDTDDSIGKENNREIILTGFREILMNKFPKGFRFGPVDKRKFYDSYREKYCTDCPFDDAFILRTLGEIAIDCGAKWYLPEQLVDDSLVAKIDEFIVKTFAHKSKYIYYSFLLQCFKNDFLGKDVGDMEILKQYLRKKYIGRYYFFKELFSLVPTKVDERDEIREFLEGKGMPLSSEEIINGLSHIPEGKIKQILGMNSEFVSNALNSWFAASIVWSYVKI